jgi:hypothetical protein
MSYLPSGESFRQMHIASLAIVAIFTLIIAYKSKSTFAWVTFGAAAISVIIAYQSLIPSAREEA